MRFKLENMQKKNAVFNMEFCVTSADIPNISTQRFMLNSFTYGFQGK